MFKNATIYRLTNTPLLDSEALQKREFVPCGPTQSISIGWVHPRGEKHGELLERIGNDIIMKLMIEVKSVPADALKRKVDEQCAHIQETTGRKPGKKERREIADDARLSLMPMAFSKQSAVMLWVDLENSLVVIDSVSNTRLDQVITQLVVTFDGFMLEPVTTLVSPSGSMASWLATKESPAFFSVDRECELKACDESKAVVKYNRHSLDTDEVVHHIQSGKVPTKLALTYNDRISFVMTDQLALKKINFLDIVFETKDKDTEKDKFDADLVIFTGEMKKFIPELFGALGGLV